ncbi:MAG TPA: hypothetical protein VEW42_01255 [Candidatus Eisenbacteria bacterium]|nr:hypothetical protein [Candidatus Eisenbacteria bacterium]
MNLEERVAKIEERNKRVETDKDWESSWMRRIILMICTYLTIALYMMFVVHINPWINAIVPTVGFFLSTLTLPWVRKFWVKYIYKK